MNEKMKGKIRLLIANKAVKNGIWLYLLQIFNSVIPLFTLPYVTRILGKEMFGLFSISINIIGYLQVVIEYGFTMSATRKVVFIKGNPDKLDDQFTSVVFARLLLFIPCILFSVAYTFLYRDNEVFCIGYAILATGLIGYCVQMNWLFQGMQEMKFISMISIISRTVSLIVIFSLVKTVNDLPLYCAAYSVTPVLNGVIGLMLAMRMFKVKFRRVNISRVLSEIKDGWFVFTTQLSAKVFNSIGITFLGIFAIASEVGEFSAIQKIPQILLLIWAPISQVLYPISSEYMARGLKEGKAFVMHYRKVFVCIFSVIALAIATAGKGVISILFGQEYTEHYYWIFPLLAWLIVGINNNFFGIQFLLGSGHDKEYSKCFQVGVICTVAFNYILIKLFGGMGAALAPLLAESILGILLWREVKRITEAL